MWQQRGEWWTVDTFTSGERAMSAMSRSTTVDCIANGLGVCVCVTTEVVPSRRIRIPDTSCTICLATATTFAATDLMVCPRYPTIGKALGGRASVPAHQLFPWRQPTAPQVTCERLRSSDACGPLALRTYSSHGAMIVVPINGRRLPTLLSSGDVVRVNSPTAVPFRCMWPTGPRPPKAALTAKNHFVLCAITSQSKVAPLWRSGSYV